MRSLRGRSGPLPDGAPAPTKQAIRQFSLMRCTRSDMRLIRRSQASQVAPTADSRATVRASEHTEVLGHRLPGDGQFLAIVAGSCNHRLQIRTARVVTHPRLRFDELR